jgi:hypothetical protein
MYMLGEGDRMQRVEGMASSTSSAASVFGPRQVYAQLATIVKGSAGREAGQEVGRSIYLTAWSQNDSCGRLFWRTSLLMKPGTEAYMSMDPRPRSEWINGTPTYDIVHPDDDAFYAPDVKCLNPEGYDGKNPLSAREFAAVITIVPPYSQYVADPVKAGKEVLDWGRRNPRLASRYPVDSWQAFARFDSAFHKLRRSR